MDIQTGAKFEHEGRKLEVSWVEERGFGWHVVVKRRNSEGGETFGQGFASNREAALEEAIKWCLAIKSKGE